MVLFSGTEGEEVVSQEYALEWVTHFLGEIDNMPDVSWAIRCNVAASKEALEACGIYTRILIRNYVFFILVGKEALYQVTGLDQAGEGKLNLEPVPFIYFLGIPALRDAREKVEGHLEELAWSLEKEARGYE